MLAKHVDDDVPSFLLIDIDGECGDGIVRQRHKRGLDRFLRFWFLSPRTRARHICKHGKIKGWVQLRRGKRSVPERSGFLRDRD